MEKNCKHFFVKPMSVLLHTFHVVLCKCLICVINKVNASGSAGTYIQNAMGFHFFPALWLRGLRPLAPSAVPFLENWYRFPVGKPSVVKAQCGVSS